MGKLETKKPWTEK